MSKFLWNILKISGGGKFTPLVARLVVTNQLSTSHVEPASFEAALDHVCESHLIRCFGTVHMVCWWSQLEKGAAKCLVLGFN